MEEKKLKAREGSTEEKKSSFFKYVGFMALAVALAVLTVIVINI